MCSISAPRSSSGRAHVRSEEELGIGVGVSAGNRLLMTQMSGFTREQSQPGYVIVKLWMVGSEVCFFEFEIFRN